MIHRFSELVGAAPQPKIAYVVPEDDGNINVWGPTATGTPVQITPDSFDERSDPVLSPDGSKVAYLQRTGGIRTLRIINYDGTGDAQLDSGDCRTPFWAPDNSKIIYRIGSSAFSILPDGTGKTTVLSSITGLKRVQYNFDGSLIAYQVQVSAADDELRVANADGSSPSTIVTDLKNVNAGWGFGWANLSNKIAYHESTDGTVGGHWYRIDSDGTNKTQLTSTADLNTGTVGATKWCWEDDDSAVFGMLRETGSLVRLYRMPANGSGPTAVTTTHDSTGLVGNGQAYVRNSRVYFAEGSLNPMKLLVSIKFDGTDYRVDHDIDPISGGFTIGSGFESNFV